MAEVKVNKEKEAIVRWPGFETPLFRGSLFHMNPFALMRRFTEEMDRTLAGTTPVAGLETELWTPAVEVKRVNGNLIVSAELPGLKKEDVKVQVTDETLVLEGERKEQKDEERKGWYHSERSYGRFYRAIPLPKGVLADKVTAEFADGVLEIAVPIPEMKNKTREIPVHEGGKVKAAG